jgi:hypothetical protein
MTSIHAARAARRKAEVISAMRAGRAEILALAETLAPEQFRQVYLGKWCLLDMLAHLAGWDDANRQAVDAVLAGEQPEFYQHAGKAWSLYNDLLVARYRQDDPAAILALTRQSMDALLARLEAVSPLGIDRDFGARFRGFHVTIGRLLDADVKDEQEHLEQLRAAFQTRD